MNTLQFAMFIEVASMTPTIEFDPLRGHMKAAISIRLIAFSFLNDYLDVENAEKPALRQAGLVWSGS